VEPHDRAHHSFLSVKNTDQVSLQGLVNLLILLLISYNIRAVVQSLEERNLVLWDVFKEFGQQGIITQWENYQTLIACLLLSVFLAISYGIEKLAANGTPQIIVSRFLF
jgi:glycyl-tRNA synthetase alpha subunit